MSYKSQKSYKLDSAAGGRSSASCTTTLPMLAPVWRYSTASATECRPLQPPPASADAQAGRPAGVAASSHAGPPRRPRCPCMPCPPEALVLCRCLLGACQPGCEQGSAASSACSLCGVHTGGVCAGAAHLKGVESTAAVSWPACHALSRRAKCAPKWRRWWGRKKPLTEADLFRSSSGSPVTCRAHGQPVTCASTTDVVSTCSGRVGMNEATSQGCRVTHQRWGCSSGGL